MIDEDGWLDWEIDFRGAASCLVRCFFSFFLILRRMITRLMRFVIREASGFSFGGKKRILSESLGVTR